MRAADTDRRNPQQYYEAQNCKPTKKTNHVRENRQGLGTVVTWPRPGSASLVARQKQKMRQRNRHFPQPFFQRSHPPSPAPATPHF